MSSSALSTFLARVRVGGSPSGVSNQADGVLLQRFLDNHDEGAFEELVRRHGPMVLSVCRRRLGHVHDAEEAFQAAFLLLACKGESVRPQGQVGAWLHGVAHRVASQAARSARRRRHHEHRAAELPKPIPPAECGELREVIDEEVARLPERYRAPLVLCLLEDRTPREAAKMLGWPEGSVSGRLSRAKRLLGSRLVRRGYGPADSLVLAAPAVSVECLATASLTAAARLAGPDGLESVRAAALMQEVIQVMWRTMMQKLIAVTLTVALVGVGVVFGMASAGGSDEGSSRPGEATPKAESDVKPESAAKLPTTTAPVQVLARVADDEVIVSLHTTTYEVRQQAFPDGTLRQFYTPVSRVEERRTAIEKVKIQNTKGKAIAKADVEKMFKRERPAVASLSGTPVDPLHLRILKDDVPVLILPAPTTPPVAPAAVAPPAAIPVVGFPLVAVPNAPAPVPGPAVPPPPTGTAPPARP